MVPQWQTHQPSRPLRDGNHPTGRQLSRLDTGRQGKRHYPKYLVLELAKNNCIFIQNVICSLSYLQIPILVCIQRLAVHGGHVLKHGPTHNKCVSVWITVAIHGGLALAHDKIQVCSFSLNFNRGEIFKWSFWRISQNWIIFFTNEPYIVVNAR